VIQRLRFEKLKQKKYYMKTTTALNCCSSLAMALCGALFLSAAPRMARAACHQGCDVGHTNTFLGDAALINNTLGTNNTATGAFALQNNTVGIANTANGVASLINNTGGTDNTATGYSALFSNTTGNFNTASGANALFSNTTASNNVATGYQALMSNTVGIQNTASGAHALNSNTNGHYNTADGYNAMFHNTSGAQNVAGGVNALLGNTTGTKNTGIGVNTLLHNTTGSNNTVLGHSAGSSLTTGSNNIDIGNVGVAAESNTIRIGAVQQAAYMSGISGKVVAGGVGVVVGANGKLGTVVSSKRYKEEIKPMDKTSEAILALQPVTFRYKHELDPNGILQFGLVAEDVEKVNPDLVARDEQGKPYTVRYEAVNAMLLNEFLKEHRKVEAQSRREAEQQASIAKLESMVAQQQEQIKAFAASLKAQALQMQKVNAQLALQKSGARLADTRD
jgi:hypothetical protein